MSISQFKGKYRVDIREMSSDSSEIFLRQKICAGIRIPAQNFRRKQIIWTIGYEKDGTLCPGKKGINLSREEFAKLVEAIDEAREFLEAHPWISSRLISLVSSIIQSFSQWNF